MGFGVDGEFFQVFTFVIAMLVILVLSGFVLLAVAQGEGKLDGLLDGRAEDVEAEEAEREDVVTHV